MSIYGAAIGHQRGHGVIALLLDVVRLRSWVRGFVFPFADVGGVVAFSFASKVDLSSCIARPRSALAVPVELLKLGCIFVSIIGFFRSFSCGLLESLFLSVCWVQCICVVSILFRGGGGALFVAVLTSLRVSVAIWCGFDVRWMWIRLL